MVYSLLFSATEHGRINSCVNECKAIHSWHLYKHINCYFWKQFTYPQKDQRRNLNCPGKGGVPASVLQNTTEFFQIL